jgi:hypothetical protein
VVTGHRPPLSIMQKEPEGLSSDPWSSTPQPNLPPPRYCSTGKFPRIAPHLAEAAKLIFPVGRQLTTSSWVCCYDYFFLLSTITQLGACLNGVILAPRRWCKYTNHNLDSARCTVARTYLLDHRALLFFLKYLFRAKYRSGGVTGFIAACGNNTQSAKWRLGDIGGRVENLPFPTLQVSLCQYSPAID